MVLDPVAPRDGREVPNEVKCHREQVPCCMEMWWRPS